MKPLNRPMFRYGGPIKEGVMSGIREPKRDGNIVGGRQSPKLAGAHPLKDASGREHHLIPAGVAIGAGLNALRIGATAAARRAIPKIANFFRTQTGTKTVPKSGPTFQMPAQTTFSKGYSGTIPGKTIGPGTAQVPVYGPNYLGRDPLVRLMGGAYKAATSPTSQTIAGKAVKFITSPSSIIGGVAYYLWPDGKERTTPPPANVPGSKAPPGILNPEPGASGKSGTSGGVELTDKERRQQQIDKYRDIMDIKGMNKQAAYDSLIAASQAINESGDFKGDIKSGKLINQIIQSTSKAFDKPKATKDAIDTLILKGEIEKDIKASDPTVQQKARLTEKQIALADKQLAGDTLQEKVNNIYAKTGAFPSGSGLAGVARTSGIDVKDVAKSEDINNFLKSNPGKDEVDFIESIVQANIKAGTPVEPGAYVVKDRIIVIDSKGNVSPYL